MLRSTSGVQSGASNLVGTDWDIKTPGFAGSTIRTVLLCDRRLAGFPLSTGIYLAAGEGGKLFKTSTTVRSYNSESSWASVTSSFGTTAIYGGHQGGGTYVYLVGASGKIGRSLQTSSLDSWTQVTSSFDVTPVLAITGHNNLYVAVGQSGKLATKNDDPDAVTTAWTQRANPFSTSTINGVSVMGGTDSTVSRYVAVGDDGYIASWDTYGNYASEATMYSNSWLPRLSSFGSSHIYDVEWSEYIGKFVAVGQGGKIATSEDGIDWTQVSNPPFGVTDIFTVSSTGNFGGLFVAAGAAGKLATSPNGSDWTLQTSGFSGVQDIHSVDGNSTTAIAGGDAGLVSITPVPEAIVTPIEPPPVPPPPPPPAATGGTVVDEVNYLGSGDTWRIHTFTNPGSFVVSSAGGMTCLVVGAGGGGHGGSAGIFGSGGYGGQVIPSVQTFSVGTYTILVGTGGVGGAYQGAPSGTGGLSRITGTGVSTTANGGAGRSSGENGQDGIGASGSGRTGVTSSITGAPVGRGGGGGYALNVGNRGFVDGGGPGGDVGTNLGSPGQTSTGGGGGGSYNNSNPGRDGGSGVVIIAYKIS